MLPGYLTGGREYRTMPAVSTPSASTVPSTTGRSAVAPSAVAEQPASWRGVLVFLALAYGLAWATQIALALAVRDNPEGLLGLGGGLLVVAAALMWPPALGAFVARRWVERGRGPDLGWRRGPWRYLLIGWLSPILLALAAMLASLPLYPIDFALTATRATVEASGRPLPLPLETLVAIQVVAALTIAVPINAVFALGEELGWRGYLLPRLVALLGPWPGLLAHGAIWGFWHAPLIVLISYNYPGHPYLGVPWFTIFGVLFGIWLGWLRLASDSVWPATVGHAALNAVAGLPLVLLQGVDPAIGGTLYSPVGWVVLLLATAWLVRTGRLPRLPRW